MAKGRGFEDIAAAMAIWGQVDRDVISDLAASLKELGKTLINKTMFTSLRTTVKSFGDFLGNLSAYKFAPGGRVLAAMQERIRIIGLSLSEAVTNLQNLPEDTAPGIVRAAESLVKKNQSVLQAAITEEAKAQDLVKDHPVLNKLFQTKFGQIGLKAMEGVKTGFDAVKHYGGKFVGAFIPFKKKFGPVVSEVGKSLKGFAGMSIQGALIGSVVQGFTMLIEALNPLRPIIETLSEIFGIWGDIIGAKLAPVMEALFKILLSPPVLKMIELLGDVFAKFFMALMPILDIFIRLVVPIITPILQILCDVFTLLAPALQFLLLPLQLLVPLFEGIGWVLNWLGQNVIKPVINFFIGVINWFIEGLNAIMPWLTFGFWVPLGKVTPLKEGGIVNRPTLAMIGEAGPEAVVPLNSASGGVGQPNITVNVYGSVVTERELIKIIDEHIAAKLYTRRF